MKKEKEKQILKMVQYVFTLIAWLLVAIGSMFCFSLLHQVSIELEGSTLPTWFGLAMLASVFSTLLFGYAVFKTIEEFEK